jgi:hypothetical protein
MSIQNIDLKNEIKFIKIREGIYTTNIKRHIGKKLNYAKLVERISQPLKIK